MGGQPKVTQSTTKCHTYDSDSHACTTPVKQDRYRPNTELAPAHEKGSRTGSRSKIGSHSLPPTSNRNYYQPQPINYGRHVPNEKAAQHTAKKQDVSDRPKLGLSASLFGGIFTEKPGRSSARLPPSEVAVRPDTSSRSTVSRNDARRKRKNKIQEEQKSEVGFFTPIYAEDDWVEVALEERRSQNKKGNSKEAEHMAMTRLHRFAYGASHETPSAQKRHQNFQQWSRQCEPMLREEVQMNSSDRFVNESLGGIADALGEAGLDLAQYGF